MLAETIFDGNRIFRTPGTTTHGSFCAKRIVLPNWPKWPTTAAVLNLSGPKNAPRYSMSALTST